MVEKITFGGAGGFGEKELKHFMRKRKDYEGLEMKNHTCPWILRCERTIWPLDPTQQTIRNFQALVYQGCMDKKKASWKESTEKHSGNNTAFARHGTSRW